MAKEIERKFLVRDLSVIADKPGRLMSQGYLSVSPMTSRVRIAGEDAYLTIKGRPDGITCSEWEYRIPISDAREMMLECDARVIEKTRYEIPVGDLVFEVDVFHGRHEGLVLAEVELPDAQALVAIPDWVGEEVSGQYRYTNAFLSGQV